MDLPGVRPGDLVGGRFQVEGQLAAGGMGTIYRALDRNTGELVALKVFAGRNATEIKRAYRESQLLAQLRHPTIVGHIADGITDRGELYLAMEWISGATVFELLEQQRCTIVDALAIGRRIATALAIAHEAGVVHRDVKPGNIILRNGNPEEAVLIDFGIARVNGAAVKLTQTGTAIGTPSYMSPEQARGLSTITPASDVFALGCVLYECLAGRPAFTGDSLAATMVKIVFTDPEPIRAHRPEVPEAFAALVHRLLRREAAERPADGRAVVDEIELLDPEPTPLPPPPFDRPTDVVHCLVIASDPREAAVTADQFVALREAAKRANGRLEVLETNHVCAHLAGERHETVRRAASLALVMRDILPGWIIGVSSEQHEPGTAADTGTALLTRSLLANVFHRMPDNAVVVDRNTRRDLESTFELVDHTDYDAMEITRIRV